MKFCDVAAVVKAFNPDGSGVVFVFSSFLSQSEHKLWSVIRHRTLQYYKFITEPLCAQ